MLTDGVEQPVPQPKDETGRRERYSGTKKQHTLKTRATVTQTALVLHAARRLAHYDNCFGLICGLTNFRLLASPGKSPPNHPTRVRY